ncbi:MAG: hypothetical protein IJD83_05135, partial [Clostridia bacterium]|nr:hypothetical protein [Clostridia bacterium]
SINDNFSNMSGSFLFYVDLTFTIVKQVPLQAFYRRGEPFRFVTLEGTTNASLKIFILVRLL